MAFTDKDLERFEATFFEEAGEHVSAMEDALITLETCPNDTELLNAIFRAAHSIKGEAGTFGFRLNPVCTCAWRICSTRFGKVANG